MTATATTANPSRNFAILSDGAYAETHAGNPPLPVTYADPAEAWLRVDELVAAGDPPGQFDVKPLHGDAGLWTSDRR